MADADDPRLDALAAAVRERRTAMGLSQGAVAARGGLGASTIKNIEQRARSSYSPATRAKVEFALIAPEGWVVDVLSNEHPGNYYGLRAVDATVASIIARHLPTQPPIGAVVNTSDMPSWKAVMEEVGRSTPPTAPGTIVEAPVGVQASAVGFADHEPNSAAGQGRMRAIRPVAQAAMALAELSNPTPTERDAAEVLWDLVDRLRKEQEAADS